MTYGYLASMKTRPGRRDEVVAILLSGVEGLRAAGCELYVISVSEAEEDTIWVTEAWRSKEDHDASLALAETRAAIEAAMPMLTGDRANREVTVVGGLGVEPAT
jgi:quinol monooxygenase YgiN